jgi:hypothetical protein
MMQMMVGRCGVLSSRNSLVAPSFALDIFRLSKVEIIVTMFIVAIKFVLTEIQKSQLPFVEQGFFRRRLSPRSAVAGLECLRKASV